MNGRMEEVKMKVSDIRVNSCTGCTYIGSRSNRNGGTGANNTAVGYQSMANAVNTYNNTAIGQSALLNCTTGTGCVALGMLAGSNYTTETNNVSIGNTGVPGDMNTIRLGNMGHTSLYSPAASSLITSGSPLGIVSNRIGILTPSYGLVGFPYPGQSGTIGLTGPPGAAGANFTVLTGVGVVPSSAAL